LGPEFSLLLFEEFESRRKHRILDAAALAPPRERFLPANHFFQQLDNSLW
jgi:hypothetical protein